MDGERELRDRHAGLIAQFDRVEQNPPAAFTSIVIKTQTVSSYPTGTNVYFGVKAVSVGGTESEGSAGTFGVETGIFYALHIGSSNPPVGTVAIATSIDGRWVFNFNG
jgi:hypothetical protein